MKIILLYGGKSPEHEISILSAYSILQAVYYDYYTVQLIYITKDGKMKKGSLLKEAPDEMSILKETREDVSAEDFLEENSIVFPCLHGPNGEDGTIQGFLETLQVPYVGCGVLASACGMDKIMTKVLMQQVGIPQVPFVPVTLDNWKENPRLIFEKCEGSLIYPMFVKPANMGSSVGISKVENREELQAALHEAFSYDNRVIVEQGIEAREIEVGILGNEDLRTTLPGEIIKAQDFYDYEEKYEKNDVTLEIPAKIEEEFQQKAQEYAKLAFQAIDGTGLARCDFFLTSNGELFFNELNTMPGFTKMSMYPALWQERGLKYGDIIEELIQLGLNRFKIKNEQVTKRKIEE